MSTHPIIAELVRISVVVALTSSSVWIPNRAASAISETAQDKTLLCMPPIVSELGPMVVTPDGRKLYITDAVASRVLVASITSNTIESEIALTGPARGIAITPDGSTVLVVSSLAGASFITLIDSAQNVTSETIPLGMGSYSDILVTSGGLIAYVLRHDSPSIVAVDLHRAIVMSRIRLPAEASSIALAGDDSVYISGSRLWELELSSSQVHGIMDLPISDSSIAVSPDKRAIALAPSYDKDVYLINPRRKKISHQIEGGIGGEKAIFSPDGRALYITYKHAGFASHRNSTTGVVSSGLDYSPTPLVVIDVSTAAAISKIIVGADAKHIAVAPNGRRIYVSNRDINTRAPYIAVIDTKRQLAIDRIDIDGPPKSKQSAKGEPPCNPQELRPRS